jgi:chaperonin GroEL (HSP60 family)
LACKSATIEVGGNTPLEKSMNMDALDDAIKACESAVKHGYYYGNNLAVFKAIASAFANEPDMASKDPIRYTILSMLWDAFIGVISTIYSNKDPMFNKDATLNIIMHAIESGDSCFDLNTEEYSDKIINSVRTDIEILRGAISIVGTIMSANQYIASEVKVSSDNK